MKRADLLKNLRAIAKAKGTELIEVREGAEHTITASAGSKYRSPATARSTRSPPSRS